MKHIRDIIITAVMYYCGNSVERCPGGYNYTKDAEKYINDLEYEKRTLDMIREVNRSYAGTFILNDYVNDIKEILLER